MHGRCLVGNPKTGARGSITNYMIDQEIYLLSYNHDPVTQYRLFGCWPKTVGDVQMDYTSQEIATVDVTFAYQRYEILPKPSSAVMDVIKRGFNRLIGK